MSMAEKVCPYCKERFWPSRYHAGQRVCSSPGCQRRRRTEYHRNKLVTDPLYREQCRHSRKKWREKNPNYLRRYRAERRSQPSRRAERLQLARELRRLADLIETSAALDPPSLGANTSLDCKVRAQSEFFRPIPRRYRRRWSEADDRTLVNLVGCKSLEVMAGILCRSEHAVRLRLAVIASNFRSVK